MWWEAPERFWRRPVFLVGGARKAPRGGADPLYVFSETMVGGAIGSRTAPRGLRFWDTRPVAICISETMVGGAIGSRTAPRGGSVPEPPLCILLAGEHYFRNDHIFGHFGHT